MFTLQIRISKFESVVMAINMLIRDQRSDLWPCTAELVNPGELHKMLCISHILALMEILTVETQKFAGVQVPVL